MGRYSRLVHALSAGLAAACFHPKGSDATSEASTSATGTTTGGGSSAGTSSGLTSSGLTSSGLTSSGSTSTSGPTSSGPSSGEASSGAQSACGNGLVEQGEECDDGNTVGGDACSEVCSRTGLVVFLSSGIYDGALGGAKGADEKCTSLANAAKLPGPKYVALLGGPGTLPGQRLGGSSLPFGFPTGTLVAADRSQLLAGPLNVPVIQDEHGQIVDAALDCPGKTGMAWTGLLNGSKLALNTCTGWIQNIGVGGAGDPHTVDDKRFDACTPSCSAKLRLYCAEYRD